MRWWCQLECVTHVVELGRERLELGDALDDLGLLRVDELTDTFVRGAAVAAVPDGQQIADLLAAEAHLPSAGHEQQPGRGTVVVVAVARCRSRRWRQQA